MTVSNIIGQINEKNQTKKSRLTGPFLLVDNPRAIFRATSRWQVKL
jgi:hypothetical protein